MHIVFLGNCQLLALADIFRRFIVPYGHCTTDFVDTNRTIDAASVERLGRAETVVTQVGGQTPALHAHIPAGVPVHTVPVVSGAFLYPYQGVQHPLKPTHAYGNTPYMPEYCDRFLARLVVDRVSPEDALAQYREHDVAASAHVGRLYELTLENQRQADAATGYDCATLIDHYLAEEQMFQSAFHFNGRIARHLASTLAERMGFDTKYSARIQAHVTEGPFVARWVPVHPSIAAHFRLRWFDPSARYPFLWEGGFTFDEYVLRFMQARWSAALQEGVIDAREGKPGARAKLERGLQEAPRSAEGHHELSRILEREGDTAGALKLQQRAARCKQTAPILIRLAHLLRGAGDMQRAAKMLEGATKADPVDWHAWILLRDISIELERPRRARLAAEQVVQLAPDPAKAQAVAARLRRQLARPGQR
jgi:tetratricopeptide (TPR) repeat protein